MLEQETLDDLFRPYEPRVTRRGEVSLHGKRNFSRPLEHLDGAEVLVGYDIHDPSRVWVRDVEDRLVAIAGLDANAQPYFPVARVEQARAERARGRLRRLAAKRDSVLAELAGQPPAIEPAGGVDASVPSDTRCLAERLRQLHEENPLVPAPSSKAGGALVLRVGALFRRQVAGETLTEPEQAELMRGLAGYLGRELKRYKRRDARRKLPAAKPTGVLALRPRAPAAAGPEALPYEIIEYSGGEDDAFFARARWLERRPDAGDTLEPGDARWLEVAQSEAWYRTLLKMERWHSRLARAGWWPPATS